MSLVEEFLHVDCVVFHQTYLQRYEAEDEFPMVEGELIFTKKYINGDLYEDSVGFKSTDENYNTYYCALEYVFGMGFLIEAQLFKHGKYEYTLLKNSSDVEDYKKRYEGLFMEVV